jgi:phytoene dehydrogenase-like protein
VDYEYYASFTGTDGRVFRLYTDIDLLERHMKELSPADAAPAEELCALIRKFASFGMPVGKPAELMNLRDGIRMARWFAPWMKLFAQTGSLTMSSFSARFKDPLIREGIANSMYGVSDSLFPLIMTMGTMNRKTAGYPLGGSLEFARAIEGRFLNLGGTVRYKARVEKVLERGGKATGVRLTGGDVIEADYVISACDLRASIYGFLDGKRIHPVQQELMDSGTLMNPMLQVSFGVNMDLSGSPAAVSEAFKLPAAVDLGGRKVEWFGLKNYAYDPATAPAGKTTLVCMFPVDWRYWEKLKGHPAEYEAEKERTAEVCINALEIRYPGIRSKIEMTDVATPLTYERYTGNWQGAYMTFILSGEFQRTHRFIPKTVPGLDGFYIASMWTNPPGGLPGAAAVGRTVVQLLCARDRKRFTTTEADG